MHESKTTKHSEARKLKPKSEHKKRNKKANEKIMTSLITNIKRSVNSRQEAVKRTSGRDGTINKEIERGSSELAIVAASNKHRRRRGGVFKGEGDTRTEGRGRKRLKGRI